MPYVLSILRERVNLNILSPPPYILTHTNLNPFPENTGCDHNYCRANQKWQWRNILLNSLVHSTWANANR